MKKIIITTLTVLLIMACSTYKSLDLATLTFGMTTQEVIEVAGKPQRILSARNTADGYQQVFEYRTAYDEVYALEFWDDYLTGYEYLYDDVMYVVPTLPPPHFPEYGRPIYIHPVHPDQSGTSNKPGRPSQSNRPNRPERPTSPRPGSPNQSQTPDKEGLTRPAETNQHQTGRKNTTRENTHNPKQEDTKSGRSGGR